LESASSDIIGPDSILRSSQAARASFTSSDSGLSTVRSLDLLRRDPGDERTDHADHDQAVGFTADVSIPREHMSRDQRKQADGEAPTARVEDQGA
jgi:hypothetical protein